MQTKEKPPKVAYASDKERDSALMGIIGALRGAFRHLADNMPATGMKVYADQIDEHWHTLQPHPVEQKSDR